MWLVFKYIATTPCGARLYFASVWKQVVFDGSALKKKNPTWLEATVSCVIVPKSAYGYHHIENKAYQILTKHQTLMCYV